MTAAAAASPPFAALVERLRERGFTGSDYLTPGPRVFTHPSTPITVSIDDSRTPARTVIGDYDTDPPWNITLAGDLPGTVALAALDAALRAAGIPTRR